MLRAMVRVSLALACLGLTTTIARADAVDVTLYFTTFNGGNNVNSVHFNYNGLSTVTFGAINNIAATPGADGIIFAPDGDLLIGGQGNAVYKVNIAAHTYTGVTPNVSAFHLSLDPSGQAVWAAGIPGALSRVPLNPFANGTAHAIT